MDGLPLLPGYDFSEANSPFKSHKVSQKLTFRNGFPMLFDRYNPDPDPAIDPKAECKALYPHCDPVHLTYGRHLNRSESSCDRRFLPDWVIYANKCLSFDAYFQQGVFGSQEDPQTRRRFVKIVYYLENDTIGVFEPHERLTGNIRYEQGKIVKRHRICKKSGEPYNWKDFNVGTDVELYGIVYRLTDCDAFTREFLTSQGVEVGAPERIERPLEPKDRYLETREYKHGLRSVSEGSGREPDRRLLRFLEYDTMVLNFKAVAEDELLLKLRYYLVDDTIALSIERTPNDGRGPGRTLLKRTRIPKNWRDLALTYPAVCMEQTAADVQEYYSPSDLKVGSTVFFFGRKIFLYDCDRFTRQYYQGTYNIIQPAAIQVQAPEENKFNNRTDRTEDPESWDRRARAQAKVKAMYNFNNRLRYAITMDAVHPEDQGRQFILQYHLADDRTMISEVPGTNSGRPGGRFLNWIRVPVPDPKSGYPYYSPKDFKIGAKLFIFGNVFTITGTEPYVYKYLKAHRNEYDDSLIENIRDYLVDNCLWKDDEDTKDKEKIADERKDIVHG